MRHPEFLIRQRGESFAELRLRRIAGPFRRKIALIQTQQPVRNPGGDVDSVGDVFDRRLRRSALRPEMFPHVAGDFAVKSAHAVAVVGQTQSEDRHRHFAGVIAVADRDSPADHPFRIEVRLLGEDRQVRTEQGKIEHLVPRRNRRVRGEDIGTPDHFQCDILCRLLC